MFRTISDWKDIDAALEEMGLLDIEIGVHTASLAERLYAALKDHAEIIGSLKADRKGLEERVNAFCLANKSEFAKRRSKVFTFGKVAFKVSEKITYDEAMEAVIISVLRKLGHVDCVNVKESIDKNAAKILDDNELARCGLKRSKEDNFRILPNISAIAQKAGKEYTESAPLDIDKLAKLVPAVGEVA